MLKTLCLSKFEQTESKNTILKPLNIVGRLSIDELTVKINSVGKQCVTRKTTDLSPSARY